MWVCAHYDHSHMTDSWVNWRCASYWADGKPRRRSENEQCFCWEWKDVDITEEPPIATAISTPQDLIMNCVSLSQLPPPNAVVWASQPTKDVFIALTWKKIFSLLYRSMKEPAPDKAKLKQIKDINTESNPKIFCNQTGIQTFTLAVVVFRGWSMGLSGLKSSRGSWRREWKRESEMIDRWWKIEGWQGWDLELVHDYISISDGGKNIFIYIINKLSDIVGNPKVNLK